MKIICYTSQGGIMKEKIFILLLLSNFVFANERKNLRIDFKSNAEFNMPKRGKLWFAP